MLTDQQRAAFNALSFDDGWDVTDPEAMFAAGIKYAQTQIAQARAEERAKAEKSVWGDRRELQIDSYATGHRLVLADIVGDLISIEVTDGSHSWRAKILAPWAAAIRARKDSL